MSRLIALAMCFLTPLAAQRDTGTIRGAVTDPSGAAVPGVRITVTDELTQVVAFNTGSDDMGRFAAPALKVSTYAIGAEMTGFKKAVRRGIILDVNQVAVVDMTLDLGQVSDVVEVTGAAPLMRTESSELGDVVEQRRVVDLPLNGRFFVNLVSLTTGGRNILSGPGTRQFDASFQKTTALSADSNRFLVFRAELFNLFNTPQLNLPDTGIGSPNVGRILAAGDPANFTRTSRQIQFGLKFHF
ncbi:MAG: carboxypeptidase regulatory-like domain-containing protein [Acidobacteria bacterium]|nr:carboxypeptidase regulatory-like domain-containing protein [Acidobacteriota bacterium]